MKMKTNYTKVFKALDKNGVIDELIMHYSSQEDIMLVKSDIIYGIELTVDFINSSSFTNMNYWNTKPQELKYQIAREIEKKYAEIMIEENTKEIEYFTYLKNVME